MYKIKEIPNHSTSEFSDKSNNYCVCIPVINEGDKIKIDTIKGSYIERVKE